ncbi:hypothetical protein Q3G72_021772 [Acer saccharum]|nr:hypothetical protein Q3G72_021772 [Acer saccharum]
MKGAEQDDEAVGDKAVVEEDVGAKAVGDKAAVQEEVGGKAAIEEDVGGKAAIEEDVKEHGDQQDVEEDVEEVGEQQDVAFVRTDGEQDSLGEGVKRGKGGEEDVAVVQGVKVVGSIAIEGDGTVEV